MPTTLVINTIGTQTVNVPFVITGSYTLPNATYKGNLEYDDEGGAFSQLPTTAITSAVANFSMTHAGNLAVGNHTVSFKDPFSGAVVVSNTFAVVAASGIVVNTPSITVGSTWTLSGTLSGYSVAPSLTYRIDNGAPVSIPSGDITTTTFSVPGLSAPA